MQGKTEDIPSGGRIYNMKPITMLKAVNEIRDDYLLEAAPKGYLPQEKKAFSWFNMRALAGAMAVVLFAIFIGTRQMNKPGVATVTPYAVYETLNEAADVTGFELECPESIADSTVRKYAVYQGTMTEVIYLAADESRCATLRKAAGSEDISGDYNAWETETQMTVNGNAVTAKGDHGTVSLLTWTEGEYSYSLSLETGIAPEEAESLISLIH